MRWERAGLDAAPCLCVWLDLCRCDSWTPGCQAAVSLVEERPGPNQDHGLHSGRKRPLSLGTSLALGGGQAGLALLGLGPGDRGPSCLLLAFFEEAGSLASSIHLRAHPPGAPPPSG